MERELQRFERPEEVEIFFSAHGVPVSYVEQVRALGQAFECSTCMRAATAASDATTMRMGVQVWAVACRSESVPARP